MVEVMENTKLYADFVQAVESYDSSAIKKCLKQVRDINSWQVTEQRDHGILVRPVLIQAISEGKAKVVETLLTAKANPDVRNQYGSTALQAAVHHGHEDIINLLLDNGANIDLQRAGETALMYAAEKGDTKIVDKLLKKGANIDIQNERGYTALMLAAKKGYMNIVDKLVDKGAKLDLQDKSGNTALMLAAQEGHTDTMNYLLKKGANTHLQNHDGKTALMLAVEQDDMDDINIVDKLVDKGAKLDLQDKSGNTALMLAAQEGHTDTMNYLLKKGANTHLQNHDGKKAAILFEEQDIDAYITNLQDKIDLIALSQTLRSNTLSTKRSVPSSSNAQISIQKIKEKRDLGR